MYKYEGGYKFYKIYKTKKTNALLCIIIKDMIKERYIIRKEKGIYQQLGALYLLIITVGVSILLLMFIGILGGQAYQLVEIEINSINNIAIKNTIIESIVNAFSALKTVGQYMPLIVLGLVIFVVLSLIVFFVNPSPPQGGAL